MQEDTDLLKHSQHYSCIVWESSKLHFGCTNSHEEPNFIIARVALIYGKSITGGSSFSEKLIEGISLGQTMSLFIDQYRSPIFVQELAMALLEIAEMTWTGIIHLGGSDRVDRYTFGLRIADLKQFPVEMLHPVSMNEIQLIGQRPRDVSMNIKRAQSLLKTKLSGYYNGLEKAYGKNMD